MESWVMYFERVQISEDPHYPKVNVMLVLCKHRCRG